MAEVNSLAWHRENLENRHWSLELKKARLEALQAEVDRDRAARDVLAAQIFEAEQRGLERFDSERLLRKRKA